MLPKENKFVSLYESDKKKSEIWQMFNTDRRDNFKKGALKIGMCLKNPSSGAV